MAYDETITNEGNNSGAGGSTRTTRTGAAAMKAGMQGTGKIIDHGGRGTGQAGTAMRQAGGTGKMSGISSLAGKSPTLVGLALRARAILKAQGGRGEGTGKKLAGMGFVVMLIISLIKDTLDLFLTITVVFSVLILAVNVVYGFIMVAYLYMNGVRPSLPKVATLALGTIAESVPIIGALLPMTTLTLVTMRVLARAGL